MALVTHPPSRTEVSGFQFNEVKAFYHDVGMDSEEDLLHAVLNAGLEPFLVRKLEQTFPNGFFFPCVFYLPWKSMLDEEFQIRIVFNLRLVTSDLLEGCC